MQFRAQDVVTLYDSPEGTAAWHAERSALAAVSLRDSGRLRLQLRGESMLPTLWPGDVVEIASCPVDDVRPGEIVLAFRAGRFFLHRFVTRKPDGFLLRGDAMPGSDPQFPNDALLGRLVGRMESVQRQAPGEIRSEGRNKVRVRVRPLLPLRPWSWAIGQLFCHCGPARRLALKLHARHGQHPDESGIERALINGETLDAGAS